VGAQLPIELDGKSLHGLVEAQIIKLGTSASNQISMSACHLLKALRVVWTKGSVSSWMPEWS
jgi:hypothetical protein